MSYLEQYVRLSGSPDPFRETMQSWRSGPPSVKMSKMGGTAKIERSIKMYINMFQCILNKLGIPIKQYVTNCLQFLHTSM